jgi:phosphomannomutase
VPRILRALGAEVIPAGRSDTFVPIDTENITDQALVELEALAQGVATAHGPVDAIVSTDGDSDRPLITAVSAAGRVRFLPGDLVGLVTAEALAIDAAAVPISANDAVERRLGQKQVQLIKTRIGSPYVIEGLDRLARDHARVAGWEANGGFLLGSALALDGGGQLVPLPTRDAVLPIVANLAAAARGKRGLEAVWSTLPARFGRAGLLDEFPVAASRAIVAQLSGEPAAVHALIARFFTEALGFGAVLGIDYTDGVRIRFANDDVAHLRPSGNAPQLRIYANADTQARADAIVAAGVAEPDGILRRLERALVGAKPPA